MQFFLLLRYVSFLPEPGRSQAPFASDPSRQLNEVYSQFAAPLDDVWTWKNGSWNNLLIEGASPSPRVYHTAVSMDKAYITFGGSAVSAGFLNDTWVLQPEQAKWAPVEVNQAPPARAGHSAVVMGSNMVLFGGRGAEAVFNDVWTFMPQAGGIAAGNWNAMKTTNAPSVRTGHAATSLGAGLMLVVGGSGILGKDMNDVWLLDTNTHEWLQVDTSKSSAQPAPRHGHLLQLLSFAPGSPAQATVVMFGGQSGTSDNDPFLRDTWTLQVEVVSGHCKAPLRGLRGACAVSGVWAAAPTAPPPRAHMAAATYSAEGDIVMFGGFSGYSGGLNDHLLSDSWLLLAGGSEHEN